MASTNEISLVLTAEDKASKVLSGVHSALNKVGSMAATVGKAVAAGAVAMGAATVAFGVSSVKAYSEAEKEMARFDQTLKNIGKTGIAAREAILKSADAAVKMGFDDETAANSIAFFMQRTNDLNKSLELNQLAMDLARAKGIDLAESSKMISLVMSGNARALKLYGIDLKEVKDPIKALAELQKKVAGQSEAYSKTTAGQLEIVKMQWENLKENVGKVVLEKLKLVEVMTVLNEKLSFLMTLDFNSYWTRITDAIVGMKNAVVSWYETMFVDLDTTRTFLKDFFIPIIISLKDTFQASWKSIVEAIQPIKPELEYLLKFFAVILVGALMAFVKIVQWVVETMVKAFTGFVNIFSGIIQMLEGMFSTWVAILTGDWNGMIAGFEKQMQGFVTFMRGIGNVVFAPFGMALSKMEEEFNRTIKEIKDAWSGLINWFKDNPAVKWIEEKTSDKKGKALGGPVSAGSAYIVGENRPEVFVPYQSGSIKQTEQVGAGKGGNVFNFNFANAVIADKNSLINEIKMAMAREQELLRYGIR